MVKMMDCRKHLDLMTLLGETFGCLSRDCLMLVCLHVLMRDLQKWKSSFSPLCCSLT